MFKFIFIRLLQSIPVLIVIVTLTFVMVRIAPGGPFSAERKIPEHILKELNEHYGLNDPLYVQYFNYMVNICPKKLNIPALMKFDLKAGMGTDLGPSTRYEGRTVNELIAESFPVSFQLGFFAILLALLIGIPVGTIAALNKNTILDYAPMSVAMAGICLPSFVLGPIFALVFGLWLEWFPVIGWRSLGSFHWTDDIPYRVLPVVTLGLYYVISYLGPVTAGVLSGSFIIEMIFQIPGLGRHFINAALNRDYTLVLGTVLFYAVLIIFLNLIVDIILVLMNPKLKFD
jgi:oligopeptide transport system permease protein